MSLCPACQTPVTSGQHTQPEYEACSSCGCRFLSPRPSAQDIARHYSQMFATGNYRLSREHDDTTARKFARLVDDYLAQFPRHHLPAPRSVLDIGCFTGEFLDAAAAVGLETFGFDTMTEAIESIADRHRVWSGSLDAGKVPGRTFDLITLNDVLEHLSDVNDSMRFAAQHLSPSGLLVMTTPATDSWAGKLLGTKWGVFDKQEHLVLFGRESVRRLLDRHGLRLLTIKPHWKSLTFSYVVEMALHWQLGSDRRMPMPNWIRRLPVRINVGEMLIVAARADAAETS